MYWLATWEDLPNDQLIDLSTQIKPIQVTFQPPLFYNHKHELNAQHISNSMPQNVWKLHNQLVLSITKLFWGNSLTYSSLFQSPHRCSAAWVKLHIIFSSSFFFFLKNSCGLEGIQTHNLKKSCCTHYNYTTTIFDRLHIINGDKSHYYERYHLLPSSPCRPPTPLLHHLSQLLPSWKGKELITPNQKNFINQNNNLNNIPHSKDLRYFIDLSEESSKPTLPQKILKN